MMPLLNFGGIIIPTFFVVISISLSFLVVMLSQRVEQLKFDPRSAFDVALILMITGFIGGRLMHVFYEEWTYYTKYPEHIFYFWQGGYVFYGGFILALVSTYLYCKIRKQSFFEIGDFFAPLLSLGHAFGRIGCFFAGCCYGSKCNLPWTIEGRHPTAIYMIIGELLIYFYLLFFETQIHKLKDKNRGSVDLTGAVFMKWILLHSLMRYFVEFFRDDFRGAFYNLPLLGKVSVSQGISLLLAVYSLIYFASKIKFRPQSRT